MAEGHAHFKLTPDQILHIKASRTPIRKLAMELNVSHTTIRRHRFGGLLGTTEREVRERVRFKERVRERRAADERALRARLRAEVGAITWRDSACPSST